MLVDNRFIFLAIPRCATNSFEKTCLSHNLELDYRPFLLLTKEVRETSTPTFHSHTKYVDYKTMYGDKYPIITITRNPIDRFISGWKFVLKEIDLTNKSLYRQLSQLGNEEFFRLFSKYFKNMKFYENSIYGFASEFTDNFVLTRNLQSKFSTVLLDNGFWTNNSKDITYYNLESDIPELEKWVSEECGIDFKMIHMNDTNDITTNLVKNQDFIDFYYSELVPISNQKTVKTLI